MSVMRMERFRLLSRRGVRSRRMGIAFLSQSMDVFADFFQKSGRALKSLRCSIAAVELSRNCIDLPTCFIHKAYDLSGFGLPMQNGPVSSQLVHQPGVGGQSGGLASFFQALVFFRAHADAGAVGLLVYTFVLLSCHGVPSVGGFGVRGLPASCVLTSKCYACVEIGDFFTSIWVDSGFVYCDTYRFGTTSFSYVLAYTPEPFL